MSDIRAAASAKAEGERDKATGFASDSASDPVSDALIETFRFDPDVRFDVCLFWDFLNYLDVERLSLLNRLLKPHLHEGTRAHGFGVFKGTAKLPDQRFGIRTLDEIVVRPEKDGYGPTQRHSQRALTQALSAFDIRRTTLSNDGRLEFLMVRKG